MVAITDVYDLYELYSYLQFNFLRVNTPDIYLLYQYYKIILIQGSSQKIHPDLTVSTGTPGHCLEILIK